MQVICHFSSTLYSLLGIMTMLYQMYLWKVYLVGSIKSCYCFGSLISLKVCQSWCHDCLLRLSNLILITDLITCDTPFVNKFKFWLCLVLVWLTLMGSLPGNYPYLLVPFYVQLSLLSFSVPHVISHQLCLIMVLWLMTVGAAMKPRASFGRPTQGCATWHVLVLRFIVIIHYGTILMCYILWTSPLNQPLHSFSTYHNVLSKLSFMFYPKIYTCLSEVGIPLEVARKISFE
jgi:hypothetical protein